jgi:hypothetical protein
VAGAASAGVAKALSAVTALTSAVQAIRNRPRVLDGNW